MGSLDHDVKLQDVLIVGSGLSGICALHHIRNRFPDWKVKCIEAGPDVGGVWMWNCFPGARIDSESVAFAYSFDKDIINEWDWKDTFAAQPDLRRYLEFVAEKKDLYRDIQFDTTIRRADWQADTHTWLLTDAEGQQYRTRFLVSCIGFLSSPTLPRIPGIETFAGPCFHTSRWPQDLDYTTAFAGKRVGVIGTGASGIQTITALSRQPDIDVTVFQRNANWSAPLRNTPITPEEMADIRRRYDDIFARCASTPAGFLHGPDPRKTDEVTPEEREAFYKKVYSEPGFGKWMGLFRDTYADKTANDLYGQFIADKIRSRVHDPAIAELLIPKNHGIGTRRIPLESGYFESYNLPNVHLVDLKTTPIEKVTPEGIVTADQKVHELDVLVCATGFSAITGAFTDIEWHGREGRPLVGYSEEGAKKADDGTEAVWIDHRPRTFLGITTPSMPNLLMVMGPHQPFGNATRNIEHSVSVVGDLLQHCHDKGYAVVEPTEAAVEAWTDHVVACSKGSLINEIDSWMTGVNKNVRGRTVRSVVRYAGSAVEYRKKCRACREAGWQELQFA